MAFETEADLPPSLACLKNVDALLRCPICFDFLNISMMTKCSHNFCSLCIRKFLSYKLQCPVCNTQMTEADLRNNRLLDDLVTNFQSARQQLLKAQFDSPPISPKTPASAVKCKTPKERGQRCNNSVLSQFFQKKPKTPSSKETQCNGSISECIQEGKRWTAGIHNDTDLHSGKAELSVVVKEEPIDIDDASTQGSTSLTAFPSISAENGMAHSLTPSKDIKPIIKVECPVCSVSVSQHFINKHLDTCLTSGDKKESLRSQKRRPMPKLVYNLLSVQELKRRLKECHLPLQGSRDQLIKRHQDFVYLYNAQCDSLNPKSGKQHSSDFSRLIAQVRGRMETTRQPRVKQEVSEVNKDVQKTHSADQGAQIKSCTEVKVEHEAEDEESGGVIEVPSSPTYSDVSVSSSISDIFGPEPARKDVERTPGQKRTSHSTEDNATLSPVLGKRRRKT
uniref:RING-type E3 ubiquitin transferase n=1 Tax=Astatotilapia calliptera TaxID=8154 RepID=A0AAX7TSN7_ASTCA